MTELTEEEKLIVAKWEREKQERLRIIDKFKDAFASGDREAQLKMIDELQAVTSDFCEHGRHYASSCIACYEIEQKLNE